MGFCFNATRLSYVHIGMSFTIDFITERARQTHSVMLVMADTWVWSELSPAEFKAKCEAAGVKIETTSDKNAATIGSKGERDQMVKDLREQMAAGIQLARIKFRKDKEKLAVLRPLRAG
jgi:UDP-2,3-diacylglucosamine pyrophosphatase LpxH